LQSQATRGAGTASLSRMETTEVVAALLGGNDSVPDSVWDCYGALCNEAGSLDVSSLDVSNLVHHIMKSYVMKRHWKRSEFVARRESC